MGSPPMNLATAEVGDSGLKVGDIHLPISTHGLPPRVTLGIRPEDLRLAGDGPTFSVTPTLIENTGADSYVSFAMGEAQVTARLAGRMPEDSVDQITLSVNPAALNFFDIETGQRITG